MAAINLRVSSYIKVEEFNRRKKEEERRGEEGTRSKGEKAVIGFRQLSNKGGGPVRVRWEDWVVGPYDEMKDEKYGDKRNERYADRREEIFDWFPPKLVASQKNIVKNVNTAKLLCFPKKTNKIMGINAKAWCCFHKTYGHD